MSEMGTFRIDVEVENPSRGRCVNDGARGTGEPRAPQLRLRRSPRLPRRIAELHRRLGGIERRLSLK